MENEKCETNLRDGISTKNNLQRNNYFKGKLLSAKDFIDEQDYHTDKIRRISQLVHGSGVIEGLKISAVIEKNKVTLTPGAAVDTQGNLLYLHEETLFELPGQIKEGDYIYLHYLEKGKQKVSIENNQECTDDCCFNKIEESFEVILDADLLTPSTHNICVLTNKMFRYRKPRVRHLRTNFRLPTLVLVGQYNENGGIDYAHVNTLYKNSELSKRLCEIFNKYVSSVNGETGDIKTISSINNAEANDAGELSFVAGNNISITSEDNALTIATKSGYYHDYHIIIPAGKERLIKHNSNRFPTVDIYKREMPENPSYTAISERELRVIARDTALSYEDIRAGMDAVPIDEHEQRIQEDISSDNYRSNAEQPVAMAMAMSYNGAKKPRTNSTNYTMGRDKVGETLLGNMMIDSLSSAVIKISDMEIAKVIDTILIAPNYNYTKVVGRQDPYINITVTHLNRNQVKLINNDTKNNIPLLVVLNT